MPEEIQEEGVAIPTAEEVVSPEAPVATPDIIQADEEAELNKKIASVTGSFFRSLSKMSDDEIYRLAFTEEGKDSPLLLKLINEAYADMLLAGGDLPRIHFDSYARTVESFSKTFMFNIESKLKANQDLLVALATGKTEKPDRISHQDIIDATNK